MGAGATSGIEAALQTASNEELEEMFKGLPEETKAKMKAALSEPGKPAWKEEYCICGRLDSRDVAETTRLVLADAEIQVKEEPRAPRMSILGQPTATSEGSGDEKKLVFWIASFENKEANDVDHKNRESNKVFVQAFFKTFALYDEGMPAMMQSMAGSYMGSCWHLEKPGASCSGTTYTVKTVLKTKGAKSAQEAMDVYKASGLEQLAAEQGALRCTLVPPSALGGDMPGPKDDVTLMWLEAFKTASDHEAHTKSDLYASREAKLKALVSDPEKDVTLLDFAETKHFAKP
eukprot:TRINITY_DN5838_c0_g1_i1.p1 TRINITY_DN5838_c0_g1~~TRINITY_DN5838_c0_g1_i1.p1  ORF type:complete len:290 (-),score=96.06 TRINITY_DN5838_c0_g1_i1:228-1097(-)